MSRTPPQDMPAEQGVLGGVLAHGDDVLAEVAGVLTHEDFYDRRHGRIFAAMMALFMDEKPVDEITVTSRLSSEGHLDAVGGAQYLGELADIIITPSHVEHYAKLIQGKAMLRGFITAAHEAIETAHTHQADPKMAMGTAEQKIYAALQNQLTGVEVTGGPEPVWAELEAAQERAKSGKDESAHDTGFYDIDRVTCGGFRDGQLILIAGRPSMGKTALALNIAEHWAIDRTMNVLFVSLEMTQRELIGRVICSRGRVDTDAWRSGEDIPWDQANLAGEQLAASPLRWVDAGGLTISELRAIAENRARRGKLDALIVDYLQLMRGKKDAREESIGEISRGLKSLAKKLKIPVIALSQLNRKVEDRNPPEPRLSDLRESGSLEQDADAVIFIYRAKQVAKQRGIAVNEDDKCAALTIAKQRDGRTGGIELVYLDQYTCFGDKAYGR